ncbi:MAG: fasciclin domain-containing protein [Blastococcus sp.]
MKRPFRRRGVLATAVTGLALALTACGSDSPSATATSSSTTAGGSAAATPSPAPDAPFGPGCAAVPAEGPGSFVAMAAAPVATAASGNPALSTVVQALTTANLVDSLNTTPELTVLAPANPAFDAVPPDALHALMADNAQLTSLLLHHVIQGRLTPDRLAGTHTTLNNDQVTIERSGGSFTIAGEGTVVGTAASVVCGNVPTTNATVYVIDQVLKPTAP